MGASSSAERIRATSLPVDLVPEILRFGDALDACRLGAVARSWRDAITTDEFWAAWRRDLALTTDDHRDLRYDYWADTRSSFYAGPHGGRTGDGKTAIQDAFEETDKNAVLGYFSLRRELERILRFWRMEPGYRVAPAGARRSSRLARTAGAVPRRNRK